MWKEVRNPVHKAILITFTVVLLGILLWSLYTDSKQTLVYGTRVSVLYDSIGNNISQKEWDVSWTEGKPAVLEDLKYENLMPGETYTYQVETILGDEIVSSVTGKFTADDKKCRVTISNVYN